LRALETFVRLFNKNGSIDKLPISIKDGPSIAWRGLSIDSARYFYPMKYLKNVVVGM
jgi:N-acetyl-beta-hexosaminidase